MVSMASISTLWRKHVQLLHMLCCMAALCAKFPYSGLVCAPHKPGPFSQKLSPAAGHCCQLWVCTAAPVGCCLAASPHHSCWMHFDTASSCVSHPACLTRSVGGCVSACRKHSREPLAASAPAFICTALPLPALMTLSARPLLRTSLNVLQLTQVECSTHVVGEQGEHVGHTRGGSAHWPWGISMVKAISQSSQTADPMESHYCCDAKRAILRRLQ